MNRTRRPVSLITISAVIQTLGYLSALPNHIGDPTWSAHAQFHLVLSWIWLVGLNGLILAIIWGPARRGERWALWIALGGYIIAQGGHFVSMLLVWEGRPTETWYHFALAAVALVGLEGFRELWQLFPKSKRTVTSTPS